MKSSVLETIDIEVRSLFQGTPHGEQQHYAALESLPTISKACQDTGQGSEFMERLGTATWTTLSVRDGTHLYTGGPVYFTPYLILGIVMNISLM